MGVRGRRQEVRAQFLPEAPTLERTPDLQVKRPSQAYRLNSPVSLRALWDAVQRRWRLVLAIEGGLLFLCLVYCLVAPKQFEARSTVELRAASVSPLDLGAQPVSASNPSSPVAMETVASVLRSEQLAWHVISALKLYGQPGFQGSFARRFPAFRPDAPTPDEQTWLLERFGWQLDVQTMPRTTLIEVRFRSGDAALSAAVVQALISAYAERESESQVQAISDASERLQVQLKQLKARVNQDEQRLADFEAAHGIVSTPETMPSGRVGQMPHDPSGLQIDEFNKQLVAASSERILTEAEYRAASQGDPELVITADPRLQSTSGFATGVLQQIQARRSELEQERAQLGAEHGPNFPRVIEIGKQLADLDRQKQAQDATLVERFRSNWTTAADREQMLRKSLAAATEQGVAQNRAATEYAAMRQETDSSRDVYLKALTEMEEAGLAAGVHPSGISVVDAPRAPSKPVTPNLPLYLAITFFVGLWLAVGGALLADSLSFDSIISFSTRSLALLLALMAMATWMHAQAPTPSTSGLPTGVARIPQSQETRSTPNVQQAPQVWNRPDAEGQGGVPSMANTLSAAPMPAPITEGELLQVSESHTPEFRSSVRVSAAGTVTLPMIGEIQLLGMDEVAAAHAIEAALIEKGMLLHPLVSVLVTLFVGQDVSVLGEVARPGVYPYGYHHRLLDLLASASGLSPNAGRLVNVFHSSDPNTPHPVVLDPGGKDSVLDHNPELAPGDIVQVSRAGLVYVVGDVIRPGGFPG